MYIIVLKRIIQPAERYIVQSNLTDYVWEIVAFPYNYKSGTFPKYCIVLF